MEWLVYGFGALLVGAGGLAIYERLKGVRLRDDRGYEPQTEADREKERITSQQLHL